MSDEKYMGTREEAESALVKAWKNWTPTVQPTIGTRKEIAAREVRSREAASRLRDAAALLAWHLQKAGVSP